MPVEPVLDDIPDSMSANEFWSLVGRLEHERIEFKGGAVSTELAEAYAALAMTSGGLVILGIRDRDRTVAGCVLSQKIYDRVKKAAHAVGVDVRLKEGRVDGTAIIIVGIPEIRGRIVTTPDGRLLRRIGSDNQPLVGDALQRFVLERSHTSSEEAAIAVFDPDEFDLELINSALEGLDRPTVPRAGVLRALQDLGLAEPPLGPAGAKIFKAALLVFGHDPARRWKGCRVQVVRRVGVGPGPGPSSAREQLSGPLPLLVNRPRSS